MFVRERNSGVYSLRPATERRLGRSLLTVEGYIAVRTILAAILIGAAVLKGYQLATEPVLGSGLLSSRVFLIAVVEFEWLFGVWLLTGMYPKWTWRVALGCFGLFACVSLYKGLSGDASCGCFGRVTVSPWWTLTMDLAAVAALLLWTPREREPDGEMARAEPSRPIGSYGLGVLLSIVVFASVSGAVAMAGFHPAMLAEDGMIVGPGDVVVLKPEKWVGKRFPLLDYIDVGGQLAHGDWLVLLYHHDCPKCLEILPSYALLAQQWANSLSRRRVALVEMPPYAAGSVAFSMAPCVYATLNRDQEWFAATPITIRIKQGRVINNSGAIAARGGSS
jgi:thiol-disulfide isomerase/thioredoxin